VDISHFQCSVQIISRYQGRRVPLRFTLAPGIFRAVGAQSLTFSKRHSFVNSRFRLGGGQYRNAIALGRT